jgi:hypothetical protein
VLADLRPAGAPGRPLAGIAELLGVVMTGPPGPAGTDPLGGPGGPVMVSGVTLDSRR